MSARLHSHWPRLLTASGLAQALLVLAGASVATADPTPAMNGTYMAQYQGGTSTWTVTSGCDTSGCTAHVISSTGWRRDAQFAGRHWVMSWPDRPDGMVCADGTTAPANVTWIWDELTLTGDITVAHGAGCGNPPTPPGLIRQPIQLIPVA